MYRKPETKKQKRRVETWTPLAGMTQLQRIRLFTMVACVSRVMKLYINSYDDTASIQAIYYLCIIVVEIHDTYILFIKKSIYLEIVKQGTLAILDLAVACY